MSPPPPICSLLCFGVVPPVVLLLGALGTPTMVMTVLLRFEGGRTSPWGGGGGGSVFGFVGGVVAACIVGNDPPFVSSSRFRVVPLFVVGSLRARVGPPAPAAQLETFMCASGGGGGGTGPSGGGVVVACIWGMEDPPFVSSSRFCVVPLFVVVSLRASVGPPPPPAPLETFMCARVVAVGPPLCVWGRGDGTLQGGRLGAGWSVSVECTPKASPCTKASYACIELIRVEPLSFGRYDWYTGRMSIVSCVVW